ncbi:hypothetical protein AB0N77_27450 [Streptomyces misionensis]|uniref:hypothetical protein n=1 Tax=Streptomyces misionensis TaxID=67331 RepID=UPI0033A1E642
MAPVHRPGKLIPAPLPQAASLLQVDAGSALCPVAESHMGYTEEQSLWNYGRTVGHLGAGDQAAGLAHLRENGKPASGDLVVVGAGAARTGSRGAAVDTSHFYAEYATAEARLRAARAWVNDVWQDVERTLDQGRLPSTEQDTLIRLALNHTTSTVYEVGRTVHRWAGSAAIRRGPIDRFLATSERARST